MDDKIRPAGYERIEKMSDHDRDVLQTYCLWRIVQVLDTLKLPSWLKRG